MEIGILNLTNWLANLLLPTLAGLMFAAAIWHFSKGQHYQHFSYSGMAALMCSGILRLLESFSQNGAWNSPDRYWLAILALVNWVGNVALPLYGVGQVVLMTLHFAGLLERLTVGEVWVRNAVSAMCCFGLSGILRLAEAWIQNGKAGIP
jgi:hypothetical protein